MKALRLCLLFGLPCSLFTCALADEGKVSGATCIGGGGFVFFVPSPSASSVWGLSAGAFYPTDIDGDLGFAVGAEHTLSSNERGYLLARFQYAHFHARMSRSEERRVG